MLRKLLCGALSAVLFTSPAQTLAPQVYFVPDDARLVMVDCFMSRGSAVRIGPNLLLSANHVTSASNCTINGQPFQVLYASRSGDFSLLSLPGRGHINIDCGGFKRGRRYVAVGHARGLEALTAVELVGTGYHDEGSGLAILMGVATVIPGQSGSGIFDRETGKMVGIVNVYDSPGGKSGSREVRDMGLCGSA